MSKSFYLSEQFQEERNEKVFIKIYTHNCCMDHFQVFFCMYVWVFLVMVNIYTK